MKYKSMEDLRNISDREVENFLKKYWQTDALSFYGEFEPNQETPENYSGTMLKVKVPGSKMLLKYPLSDVGYVSFKIPANKKLSAGYYKFNCRLLPSYNNRCRLQIFLNTLEEIDSPTYNEVGRKEGSEADMSGSQTFASEPLAEPVVAYSKSRGESEDKRLSPVARRLQTLKDEQTGWGADVRQLMGLYKRKSDGTYWLDDIRKTDLTQLHTYPKTTFRVGPLALSRPVEGLSEGQYCLFSWRFTFDMKVNPCEIKVDEAKPIEPVNPEELVSKISQAIGQPTEEAAPVMAEGDARILVSDLLHEANKPTVDAPVDVQFHLTPRYLSFQHTGRAFSADALLNYCGLISPNGRSANDNIIMFHCPGFRHFLLSNPQTIIISNGFFIRVTSGGNRLYVAWLNKEELPRGLKISMARNKRFKETVIVPFGEDDKQAHNNYKAGLRSVMSDLNNIVFYSRLGKVVLKFGKDKPVSLDRKGWIVSKEYQSFVHKNLRDKFGAKSKDGEATQSIKKNTAIIFACRLKGKQPAPVADAPVCCLLPTSSKLGFPFMMQLDIQLNKTNNGISHKSVWNKAYAEIAGRLFSKWLTDLALSGEYTATSIYKLSPKFAECINQHPEEKAFIELFQKGFKEVFFDDSEKARTPSQPAKSPSQPAKADQPAEPDSAQAEPAQSTGGTIYVFDTNAFVNCPDIINRIGSADSVIISAKVVDELDKLKNTIEESDQPKVGKALKYINAAIDRGNVTMETSKVSLLPSDFDRRNPDNHIISVLLRHKKEGPVLVTSDNGMQIKAKGLGLNVIGLKEFLAAHRRKQKTRAK